MSAVLWTTCQHAGAHHVDLTWTGFTVIMVSAIFGWLIGITSRRSQR